MRFVHFRTLTIMVGLSILLILTALPSMARVAADTSSSEPGEQLFSVSGTLSPGQKTMPYQVFTTGIVNFELVVNGGAATDALTLKVTQGEKSQSWQARSGEQFWGTVPLNTTSNQWQIENPSSTALSYKLTVYAQGEVPVVAAGGKSWSGVGVAGGGASTIRLHFPRSGLYDFAFTVGEGRYQFQLDSAYFQHAVQKEGTVRVYVAEGVHRLRVRQDPNHSATTWGVSVAMTEQAADKLAYQKSEPAFGGDSAFSGAWFPIALAEETAVNLQLTVAGAATDRAVIELYPGPRGGTPSLKDVVVHGGETVWLPVKLAKGVSRLRVVAATENSKPVSASLTVRAVPSVPLAWAGRSRGANSRHSRVHLDVPVSGLYQFDFGVSNGRFQFHLDNKYFQVTVDEPGNAKAYLSEGRHTLTVVQDSTADLTTWKVAVKQLSKEKNTLPYTQIGGKIGGSGNDFTQEWWPLVLETPAKINVRLTVSGTVTNSLSIQVHDAEKAVASRSASFGGETVWLTTDLSAGANRLHLVAGQSGEPLSYKLDVFVLPEVPAKWSGVALSDGADSFVRFMAPVDGVYDVTFSYSAGMILPVVDPGSGTATVQQENNASGSGTMQMRVPLERGVHTVQLRHDRNQPRTVWQGEVTLREADENQAPVATGGFVYLPTITR